MLVASFLTFAVETRARGAVPVPARDAAPALRHRSWRSRSGSTKFANVKLPDRVVGFTWEQVHLVLGLLAGLMAVGWLITDIGNKEIGFWLEVLGGIALAVGAVMMQRERHTGAIG